MRDKISHMRKFVALVFVGSKIKLTSQRNERFNLPRRQDGCVRGVHLISEVGA